MEELIDYMNMLFNMQINLNYTIVTTLQDPIEKFIVKTVQTNNISARWKWTQEKAKKIYLIQSGFRKTPQDHTMVWSTLTY